MGRYSRQVTVPEIGVEGQARLRTSRVVVVGAGGLGIPACSYLVAAGVGTLTVIDDDVVDESNLARQVLFDHDDVGRPKLDALVPKLARQNPDVLVRGIDARLSPGNAARLLHGADVIIDASDNFATRYALCDAAIDAHVPHVWGAVYRFEGSVGVFPPETTRNYRALYPERPPAFLAASCDSGGVAGPVCGLIGSLMASQALQYLVGERPGLWARTATIDASSFVVGVAPVFAPPVTSRNEAPASKPIDIKAEDVAALLSVAGTTTVLIDVRSTAERNESHIAGSLHVALNDLWEWSRASKPADAEHIIFYCKSGARSRQAVQIWRAVNDDQIRTASVIGGIDALRNLGDSK